MQLSVWSISVASALAAIEVMTCEVEQDLHVVRVTQHEGHAVPDLILIRVNLRYAMLPHMPGTTEHAPDVRPCFEAE